MALIHCSECGQQISDKAKSCPKCGAPVFVSMSQKTDNKTSVYVTLGYIFSATSYFIFPFIFAIFGFVLGILNTIQKEEKHGIIQIVLSVLCLVIELSDEIY